MRYRKKPVVIEAWLFKHPARMAQPDWLLQAFCDGSARETEEGTILIETLEGSMVAHPGDWIIQGVQGEIYPCKPDIFAATYEEVEDV